MPLQQDSRAFVVYSILGAPEEAVPGTESGSSSVANSSSLTQFKDKGNTYLNERVEKEPDTLICSYSDCVGEV